ncbi:MAG: ComF family protein [Deltaproteobacteria bacterium]|nr:ComF family protein [Deltaproteobacteria bacterium]
MGRAVAIGVLDLLFPHRCPACDALSAGGPGFCPRCAAALVPVPATACPICGAPQGGDGPAFPCPECRSEPPPFAAAASAWLFGGPLAEALGRFKAGRVPEFPTIAAPSLAAVARGVLATGDPAARRGVLAVAVPPDPGRLARRGFDPGTLVAAATARRLDLPFRAGLLVSAPRPRPQRTLSRAERRRALAGVFSAAPWAPRVLAGRTVLLLDDVRTTGSTTAACAALLRRTGAAVVRVATLALVE